MNDFEKILGAISFEKNGKNPDKYKDGLDLIKKFPPQINKEDTPPVRPWTSGVSVN